MLLRNQERYLEVLEVGNSGQRHRRVLDSNDQTRSNGRFFDHGDATFGLGVSGGEILVLLRDQLVPYASGFETQVHEEGERRIFIAAYNGEPLVRVTYTPARPSWNFFAEEDEDVDGLLWIHNVLSSEERRAILVEANGG